MLGERDRRQSLENGRGLGPLDRQLGVVIAAVHGLHHPGVLPHPGKVLRPVAGIDANENALGRETVGHHVVDEATAMVEQPRVHRLAVGDAPQVVGDEPVGRRERSWALEFDLPMCETSNSPAALRTASCSAMTEVYWTGISQPAKSTNRAPSAR